MGAQALCHSDGFDFLAMGRWELAGSQCTVNRVLERALVELARQYDVVLVDNEAGVEHVGRFASTPIDLLLLMATPEALSLNVAGQIMAHCREVQRPVRYSRCCSSIGFWRAICPTQKSCNRSPPCK